MLSYHRHADVCQASMQRVNSTHLIVDSIHPLLELRLEADGVAPDLLFVTVPVSIFTFASNMLYTQLDRPRKTYVLPNVSKETQLLADEVDIGLQSGEFGLDVRQGLLHRIDLSQVPLCLVQLQLSIEAAGEEKDERGLGGDDSE